MIPASVATVAFMLYTIILEGKLVYIIKYGPVLIGTSYVSVILKKKQTLYPISTGYYCITNCYYCPHCDGKISS